MQISQKKGENMLRIQHVTKQFGGLKAVNDVSLEVEKGSIVGLIGPNGSGKTTLFNLISGLYPLTAGKVFFNDRDITTMQNNKIADMGLARTFQVVKPFNNISAKENVMVGAFQRYPKRVDAERKAMEAMRFLGIEKYANVLPPNLPLAIKKQLEIARILTLDPELILLDEVMGGLNTQETSEILTVIESIRDSGITILIIEHKMKAIMRLSDKVAVLNNGGLIAYGEPEDVVANPVVAKAYLGDDYDAEDN